MYYIRSTKYSDMKNNYSFRLDKDVIDNVDLLAVRENRTRSNMVEELLIRQLDINLNTEL